MQTAHEILSEQFPHVIIAVEAQFAAPNGMVTSNQMMRWYGDSTTATGLIIYASDVLSRTFGGAPPANPTPPPPIKAPQEDALATAQRLLGEQFTSTIIVAQGEAEFIGTAERSVKALRCSGGGTTVAGLALFASNALRKMAVGM